VKLLLDANLSPSLVVGLGAAGFATSHVGDVDLLTESDAAILDFARERNLVIVTADSDFSAMLASGGASGSSVVHLRGVADLTPAAHERLLVDNLASVAEDLESGAIVSLSPGRLAVRRLPIS